MQQKAVPVALFSGTQTHVTLPATEQRLGVPAGPGFDFMFFTKDTISLFSVFIIRQGVPRSRCAGNGKWWVCCRWCLSATFDKTIMLIRAGKVALMSNVFIRYPECICYQSLRIIRGTTVSIQNLMIVQVAAPFAFTQIYVTQAALVSSGYSAATGSSPSCYFTE